MKYYVFQLQSIKYKLYQLTKGSVYKHSIVELTGSGGYVNSLHLLKTTQRVTFWKQLR